MIALAAPAAAQVRTADRNPPPSDGDRPLRVSVKFIDSGALNGRLADLGTDSVTVVVDGVPVKVPLARVRSVTTAEDSVMNGAIIGGLIAGVYCAFVCGQGLDSTDSLPRTVLGVAGTGALIGAIVDSAKSDTGILYPSPPAPGVPRRSASRGLRLSIRF